MIGRIGKLLVMMALCAVFAYSSSSAAAKAVAVPASCSHPAAFSHRGQAFRSLTSADQTRLQKNCSKARRSYYKLAFWYSSKRRWTLYLHQSQQKCWQIRLSGPEPLCRRARAEVRVNRRRLMMLSSRIEEMTRLRLNPVLLQALTCIHGHEGAWNANTGNGYYGGLQMDHGFMKRYGLKFLDLWGTADRWPPWAQLQAAAQAYASGRGLGPWPNTHLDCGLPTFLPLGV